MGLLESVIGALAQGAAPRAENPQQALIGAILSMLMSGAGGPAAGGAAFGGGGAAGGLGGLAGGSASGGIGGLGGLAGLVEQFSRAGLGDVVGSWVGRGQNLPISPDQLGQVLGGERIGAMAGQLGMDQGDLLGQLSQMLPQVVDRLTPEGQVPQGDLAGALGSNDLDRLLGGLMSR
jgi:uncharacterized protein YidB (DUF937 family)